MLPVIRLARLPAPERAVLLEALATCTVASVLLRLLAFRRLARSLGRHMQASAEGGGADAAAEVARVRWAVAAAARHLPWRPVCLPQAVTAQWMLRRRRIPSTLYLGADPARAYDAHAWVRAGSTIVTGGPGQARFTIVASFT